MPFEPAAPPEKKELSEPEQKTNIVTVFRDSTLRRNLMVLWVMWFVTGSFILFYCYYSILSGMTAYLTDLCGGDMTKNFWLGQFLSGILLSAVRIVSSYRVCQ